jgi:Transposase IS200 like
MKIAAPPNAISNLDHTTLAFRQPGCDPAEMQDYKRGSHTIWDCKYHLVWVTKYRYPILVGEALSLCRWACRSVTSAVTIEDDQHQL